MLKKVSLCQLLLIPLLCGCSAVRQGDLLFVVAPDGNAITAVTHGAEGRPIDHVAIYDGRDVVEAVPGRGVCVTPRDSFFNRHRDAAGRSLVLVGRVRKGLDRKKTIGNARRYLSLPYDSLYSDTDDAIYCSELVQKSYVDRQGRLVFETIPMEFRDSTGQIPRQFIDFYRRHGMAVPEGHPGTNPGQLSRSPLIHLNNNL